MLKEILGEPEKLEEKEKLARILSSLIFPLWIGLLLFTPFLYTMADRIEVLQDTYKMRTALEEIIVFLNYQIISIILSGVLGVLIFVSIILAERPSTLNKLGGIMFGVSSVFDGLMAYELSQVKGIYEEILHKFVLLTSEALNNYMNRIQEHYFRIIMYNRLSAIFIGTAFVFFGIDAISYSRKIEEALPKSYPIGIVESVEYELTRSINMIKTGASRLKWAGILFLISGILDILFGVFSSGEFANIAFVMFLIGLFLESSSIKMIKDGYSRLYTYQQTVSLVPKEESEDNSEGIVNY